MHVLFRSPSQPKVVQLDRNKHRMLSQGLKRDREDGRAHSFLVLLELMPSLTHPPKMLLLEVGPRTHAPT